MWVITHDIYKFEWNDKSIESKNDSNEIHSIRYTTSDHRVGENIFSNTYISTFISVYLFQVQRIYTCYSIDKKQNCRVIR